MKTEFSEIATQYAQAVMEIAVQSHVEETILQDLQTINKVIATIPDFAMVLGHPTIANSEKKRILVELFQGKINDLTQRLLELLSDKRRVDLLVHIETEYQNLLNQRKNIVNACLTSADPLAEAAIAEIKNKLTKQLGKEVHLDVKIDKSLMGGLILRLGDQVIDGSLRGKLEALEKNLLSV